MALLGAAVPVAEPRGACDLPGIHLFAGWVCLGSVHLELQVPAADDHCGRRGVASGRGFIHWLDWPHGVAAVARYAQPFAAVRSYPNVESILAIQPAQFSKGEIWNKKGIGQGHSQVAIVGRN